MMIFNSNEFAELLGVTRPTIRQWIKNGLPAKRIGDAGNSAYEIDSVAALHWLTDKRVAQALAEERQRTARHRGGSPFSDSELVAVNREIERELATWRLFPALNNHGATTPNAAVFLPVASENSRLFP